MGAIDLDSLVSLYQGGQESQFLRVLVYGAAGSGKTTLLGTFPKPFFIDFDKGMSVLKPETSGIPSIRMSLDTPNAFEIVVSVLQDAIGKSGIFSDQGKAAGTKTLVIDSFTNMVENFVRQAMKDANRDPIKGKPGFDEWGRLKQQCVYIASLLRDLSMTMHVGITALVTEKENELTKVIRGSPDIAGSYRDRIGADMDENYYMESSRSVTGGQTMTMHASKWRGIYEAKTRVLDKLDFENPTFQMLEASMAAKRARA